MNEGYAHFDIILLGREIVRVEKLVRDFGIHTQTTFLDFFATLAWVTDSVRSIRGCKERGIL